jgi:CHAD domain
VAKARAVKNLDASAPVVDNAYRIAKTRLEELYEWDAYVDEPYRVHELHNLRIAAKRLRYTLEIFAEVLPEKSADVIEALTRVQDGLGALHDSDVMIALLRLCLGCQDSGSGYRYALAATAQRRGQGRFDLDPVLLSHLVAPDIATSAEQRQGLERLLRDVQERRKQEYAAFRQRWYQLKARDFRHEILDLLDRAKGEATKASM